MPVTPLSTPLKTEYKPLGLEAFAQPLSQMAAQFDAVAAELEDTDYTLSRLQQDDPEAKALLNSYQEESDKISKQLMKDQNYRLAHTKIKRLNKKFAKDMEAQAYKSNYNLNAATIEKVQKMYDKKELDERDFKNWKYYQQNHFKGTKYDPATGQYTRVSSETPSRSVEKEIMEKVEKLLNMTPSQEQTYISNLGLTSQGAAELKEVLKFKKQQQISDEVRSYLLQSDRYKDAIIDKAKYQFFYNNDIAKKQNIAQGKDPMEYSKGVIQNFGNNLAEKIAQFEEASKTAKGDEKIYIDNQLQNLTETAASFQKSLGELQTNEDIEKYAEQLFKQESLGYFDRVAGYGADLIDYNKLGKTLTYRDATKGKSKAAKAKADEIGTVGTILTNYNQGEAVGGVSMGIGPQEEIEQAIDDEGENIVTRMNDSLNALNSPYPKEQERDYYGNLTEQDLSMCTDYFECSGTENYFNEKTKEFIKKQYGSTSDKLNKSVKNNIETAVQGFTLIDGLTEIEKSIKYDEEEIANKKNKLSTTTNPDEKARLQAEIITLGEDKTRKLISLEAEKKDLNNLIKKYVKENPQTATIGGSVSIGDGISIEGGQQVDLLLGGNYAYRQMKDYVDGNSPYTNPKDLIQDILYISRDGYNIAKELSPQDKKLTTSSGFKEAREDLNNFYIKINNSTYWPEIGRRARLYGKNGWLTDDPNQQWNFTDEQKALTARLKKEKADLEEKVAKAESFKGRNVVADVEGVDVNDRRFKADSESLDALSGIFNDFKKIYTIQNPKLLNPSEIVVDEHLEKMTNGASKQHIETIKNQQQVGSGKISRITEWDPMNQTYKISPDNKADLANYKDNPTLTGYTKEGEPVYRYSLKEDLSRYKFHSKSAAYNYITTGKYATRMGKNQFIPGTDEFYANHPENLYLKGERTNINVAQEAKQNYHEIYINAGPGVEGEQVRRDILDNYTNLALVSSPNRKDYHRFSLLIKEALESGQDRTFQVEPPAVFRDNGDDTYTGYGIQYHINDGQLKQTVIEYTKNAEGNILSDGVRVIHTDPVNIANNLPRTLLRNNLFYGAGSEEDIPMVSYGFDDIHFVPVFQEMGEQNLPQSILAPGQKL